MSFSVKYAIFLIFFLQLIKICLFYIKYDFKLFPLYPLFQYEQFLAGIILGKLFLADPPFIQYDKCSLKWSNCLHILFDLIGVRAVAFWQ